MADRLESMQLGVDEVVALRQQLAEKDVGLEAATQIINGYARDLAECQAECEEEARLNGAGSSREAALLARLEESLAREKVLRGALTWIASGSLAKPKDLVFEAEQALALPSDSTALDSAIRQAKREENEECADICDRFGVRNMHPAECSDAIRSRMADDLK